MARKSDTASADQSDAPLEARIVGYTERDGQHYPALSVKGTEAHRKGSNLRVSVEGTVYTAKVYGTVEADGETRVETEGLTPEQPDAEAPAPASDDIVPG